jgi:hypothetical protein
MTEEEIEDMSVDSCYEKLMATDDDLFFQEAGGEDILELLDSFVMASKACGRNPREELEALIDMVGVE